MAAFPLQAISQALQEILLLPSDTYLFDRKTTGSKMKGTPNPIIRSYRQESGFPKKDESKPLLSSKQEQNGGNASCRMIKSRAAVEGGGG